MSLRRADVTAGDGHTGTSAALPRGSSAEAPSWVPAPCLVLRLQSNFVKGQTTNRLVSKAGREPKVSPFQLAPQPGLLLDVQPHLPSIATELRNQTPFILTVRKHPFFLSNNDGFFPAFDLQHIVRMQIRITSK